MNENVMTTRRTMLPRWRPVFSSIRLGEGDSLSSTRSVIHGLHADVESAVRAWKANPSVYTAGELLACATFQGDRDLMRVAGQYLRNRRDCHPIARAAAESIMEWLDGKGDSSVESEWIAASRPPEEIVRVLRGILRDYPHETYSWIDLSLAHASLGNLRAARRAMEVGLALDGSNRLVTRSAVRLLVHIDELEYALHVLNRNPRLDRDPWLISAQLSLSTLLERPLRLAKRAMEVSADDNITLYNRSELFATLATEERMHGRDRKARQLFHRALIQGTENSLAQAIWAQAGVGGDFAGALLDIKRPYEAKARNWCDRAEWRQALACCEQWMDDERFSARPAILASYVACLSENYRAAITIASRGLRANPENPVLVNNIAFALAWAGEPEKAHNTLLRTRMRVSNDAERIPLLATEGLIEMRRGNINTGILQYEEAIQMAHRSKLEGHAALASIYLAREIVRLRRSDASVYVKRARSLAGKRKESTISSLLSRLEKDFHA